MLVRFLGFSVKSPPSIPLNKVMEDLEQKSNNYEQFDEAGRFLFVDTHSDDNYYLGLIVTVKNQRTFCELRETGTSFKVRVNQLDANSNIMEFNFFVINKDSGVGLYQHYHQSCSIGQGINLIKKHFAKLKDLKRKVKKEELIASGTLPNKAEKKVKKIFKGFFKWEILVRKDKLAEVLSELERIKALEIDLAYLEPDSKEFGQLSGFVRKQRRKFSFIKKANPYNLIQPIVSAVNKSDTKSGRVFGIDDQGVDRIIKIQNNPDNFGEFDYDEVATHINNLDVSDFKESWIIHKLKEACENNSSTFKAKIK